jgi:hypothetical protein
VLDFRTPYADNDVVYLRLSDGTFISLKNEDDDLYVRYAYNYDYRDDNAADSTHFDGVLFDRSYFDNVATFKQSHSILSTVLFK